MELVVENVTKSFGRRKAIDSLSFNARKGEIIGLWGADGAGKSTAMKILAGILYPDRGSVFFTNRATREPATRAKAHIGYMAEHNPMYEKMNVVDFLLLIGTLYRVSRHRTSARIREIMPACGLENEKYKNIGELSKGCRQRLGIAQALVHDPEVLLLDEPTAGLDPNQGTGIRNIIRAAGKEKIVIIGSRLLTEIESTCERVIIMHRGKIVANQTTRELQASTSIDLRLKVSIKGGNLEQVKEVLRRVPGIHRIIEREGEHLELRCKRGSAIESSIFDACQDNHWYITELTPLPTHPEELLHPIT
ncbi:MAG: ATP-binding cassette domain-containing protein [Odoribacteraceae bacterium]|jgi:ABC-2 type transport system ATP-binding protein|nr:ATP-binding cassette domain-containing protein [Odoribacteraceae bacterium]